MRRKKERKVGNIFSAPCDTRKREQVSECALQACAPRWHLVSEEQQQQRQRRDQISAVLCCALRRGKLMIVFVIIIVFLLNSIWANLMLLLLLMQALGHLRANEKGGEKGRSNSEGTESEGTAKTDAISTIFHFPLSPLFHPPDLQQQQR